MRLVIASAVVVAGFFVGVLGIARLTENSPAWLRLTFVTIWLFAIIVGAFLLGNKRQRGSEQSRIRVRDSLLYVAIAFVFVTVGVAVIVHDVDNGIKRNVKENWLIGVIIASFVCGYAIKEFWRFRRSWRIWAVLAAYLILHFSIAVPALGRLERIPAIYIWPIGTFEFMLIAFALQLVTASQTQNWR